ncbi:MAG: outer membrane lipoprotein carrier protein LolA [Gammaproteobacteria bacterium]|jgi:outer membrane lipoprotein carrier protein|nr:outer membrane lipoprotein carrier protein LolA [Gammaproteobacteria bacterium]MBT5202325.1 outer membrane lipoprotein carrier protein LolA [Gammaproteobacteria bacterium]MBT5601366.1 outer membrane lipoprotein carrier protein LolA [Gammaproteobacteria bacterium]MBT6246242.1 outer membrane lipoprotein carrier protein LolA [Gammaproteobacteria bacterium]
MPHLTSLIIGLGLLAIFPAAADGVSQERPADLLMHHLSLIEELEAFYSQKTDDDRVSHQHGRFWLRQPGQFRIQPADDMSPLLVSDGIDLWEFDALLEQVVVQPVSLDPTVSPVLLLADPELDLEAHYEVALYRDDLEEVFALSPLREDAFFRNLSLHFRDGLPVRIGVFVVSGQYLEMDIEVIEHPGAFPVSLFQFDAPDGVDIIDYRQ